MLAELVRIIDAGYRGQPIARAIAGVVHLDQIGGLVRPAGTWRAAKPDVAGAALLTTTIVSPTAARRAVSVRPAHVERHRR